MMSFAFNQAMQKIVSTPTHGNVASQIHKVNKQVSQAKDIIIKKFQTDLVQVYGKKDDKGAIIRPEGEPNGFEPVEGKTDEFVTAQEEFGKNTVELDVQPFNVQLLGDIKVSAADLEALKGLWAGNNAPEVPLNNVASIR